MDEGDAFQCAAGGGVAAVRLWRSQFGATVLEHAPIGQFSTPTAIALLNARANTP